MHNSIRLDFFGFDLVFFIKKNWIILIGNRTDWFESVFDLKFQNWNRNQTDIQWHFSHNICTHILLSRFAKGSWSIAQKSMHRSPNPNFKLLPLPIESLPLSLLTSGIKNRCRRPLPTESRSSTQCCSLPLNHDLAAIAHLCSS